jgi:outer membrane lipoprotein-sorting protein
MILLLFFNLVFAQGNKPTPEQLLRFSDRSRGGLEQGISWIVQVISMEDGTKTDRTFSVKAKVNDALVEAETPPRFKGEVYLFNDRTMWFYKPSIKKPISVSARQKLSGQAANGDIASTHYARDYIGTLEKMEKIGKDNCYVLLLKAKSPEVTYDKIRYWVSEKSKLALRAEFLTLEGKPFKVAQFAYANQIKFQGKQLPFLSEMLIQDASNKNNASRLKYSRPKPEQVSETIFNVNNLKR